MVGTALIQGNGAHGGVEQGDVVGVSLRKAPPPAHEGLLDDVFGVSLGIDELTRVQHELWGELLKGSFPVKGGFHAGAYLFHLPNATGFGFLYRKGEKSAPALRISLETEMAAYGIRGTNGKLEQTHAYCLTF